MMGERTVMQEALFYSFRIEDHVPQDHLLRSVDRFVDLTGVREHLKPFYSSTDRKSVVEGKSVDLGGRRIIKKKNHTYTLKPPQHTQVQPTSC